jgi:hypothetical protein
MARESGRPACVRVPPLQVACYLDRPTIGGRCPPLPHESAWSRQLILPPTGATSVTPPPSRRRGLRNFPHRWGNFRLAAAGRRQSHRVCDRIGRSAAARPSERRLHQPRTTKKGPLAAKLCNTRWKHLLVSARTTVARAVAQPGRAGGRGRARDDGALSGVVGSF